MPEPIQRGRRYIPGLDGLRAIAVLAVIAYHLNFSWAPGGLLGVGVFFTLSGYLITDLLLAQVGRGGIRLKAFWLARARRLFPALFVMLAIVLAWVTVIGPHQGPDFPQAVLSAGFYVNNWWLIFHHVSYFAQFSTPSPLNHLWSLSVEEQFYIFWPFLMILGTRLIPETGHAAVRFRLAEVTLALALASGILMAVLYHPSLDPSRVYYGTDTRAMELLVGAAVAMIWPSRRLGGQVKPEARRLLDLIGSIGLLVVFIMFWRTGEYSSFLYRGGFLVLSVATVLAVAAMVHPASRLGPVVGCRPMRWIGERSYGIYLWHFPIIVLTTPAGSHSADLGRSVLQVAAIIIVSALSWRYIENPIRHGALKRLRAQFREGRWHLDNMPSRGWAVIASSSVVLVLALAGMLGFGTDANHNAVGSVSVAKTFKAKRTKPKKNGPHCTSVVHIGDSTSEGLVSSNYLPNPHQLIDHQYARVGVTTTHLEVSGARSIYETFEGMPNAHDVAQAWKDQGYEGCWVLALGTNEAANVGAGSNFGFDDRIKSMMDVIGHEPVMWVNVRTLVTTGPYANANMLAWDKALVQACNQYPNMRVYDWASAVKNKWFIDDGTHFTTPGYAQRSRLIANALRDSFPADGSLRHTNSSNCVVSTPTAHHPPRK